MCKCQHVLRWFQNNRTVCVADPKCHTGSTYYHATPPSLSAAAMQSATGYGSVYAELRSRVVHGPPGWREMRPGVLRRAVRPRSALQQLVVQRDVSDRTAVPTHRRCPATVGGTRVVSPPRTVPLPKHSVEHRPVVRVEPLLRQTGRIGNRFPVTLP